MTERHARLAALTSQAVHEIDPDGEVLRVCGFYGFRSFHPGNGTACDVYAWVSGALEQLYFANGLHTTGSADVLAYGLLTSFCVCAREHDLRVCSPTQMFDAMRLAFANRAPPAAQIEVWLRGQVS